MMRKVAALLFALIFAGSVGGVGCFAAASEAAALASSAMACCTPDCPAPATPNPAQSCATQTCEPSVEVAPGSHGALHPSAPVALAVAIGSPPMLRPILTVAAASRSGSRPSFDSSLAFDWLCSRQI